MEWEFSPQQVVQGESDYGLTEFRRDLAEELKLNLPCETASERERQFALAYDLCYWLATERPFVEFLNDLADDPDAIRLAHLLREPMQTNVEMLGAILQREINHGIALGLTVEAAVERAATGFAVIARDSAIDPRG